LRLLCFVTRQQTHIIKSIPHRYRVFLTSGDLSRPDVPKSLKNSDFGGFMLDQPNYAHKIHKYNQSHFKNLVSTSLNI
jgi:hypothetical protein